MSRVSAARLSSQRLDADFYRPEFLRNEETLLTNSVRRLGDVGHFFAGPFGSLLPSNLYLDKGIPLFRVGNVGQFEVLTDNLAHLAPHIHDELKASEVRSGDLLVVKASVGEKICKVPDWIPRANITQHIIGIRPNGKFDTDFVSAFLFSRFGVLQLQRYSLGSIIQYLGIKDAKGTYIVEADSVVQKYIGDKVRQAERLRAWALKLERHAKNKFQKDFQWDETVLSVKTFNRLRADELENRLDLKYNSPQRLAAIRHAKSVDAKLQQLDELVEISAMIGWKGLTTENYTSSGPWLLRGVEFNSGVIRTEDLVCVEEHKYLEQPQIHLKEGDIAFTKDGTIGKSIVIPRLLNRMAAGSTVARLRKKATSDVDAYYLEFTLAHEFVQCQIASFATGVAQPHITQEWIALLKIPRVKSENDIAWAWQQHHESLTFAKQLTRASKLLVEALIGGQLTEAELITSEKALQAGNDRLDRYILNRLNTDGIDGQGPALFNDLDELYRLLAQAEVD
ncbi:hypothetical protein [Pseudomonas viridiflava]|nr:hypothetical protein [Pseudomonas viridiflava]